MKEIIFAVAGIIAVLLVGMIAARLNRRVFPQRPKTSARGVVIATAAALIGFSGGFLLIPLALIPENTYIRLMVAVGITVVLGAVELSFVKNLSYKWRSAYILDNDIFPFISLGVACALLLKPYVA